MRTTLMTLVKTLCLACLLTLAVAPARGADDEEPLFKFVGKTPALDSAGALVESSGLVVGRRNPGVVWTHNDGPDLVRLLAFSTEGRFLGSFAYAKALSFSMEDIACGPGPRPGVNYLYLGLIGDNMKLSGAFTVYRAPEPEIDLAALPEKAALVPLSDLTEVEKFSIAYPDGAHDAECLLIEPESGDLYVVAKGAAKGDAPKTARVYRVRAGDLKAGQRVRAERVATIASHARSTDGAGITGGDVSADGRWIVLKNTREGFVWRRDPEKESLADMFRRAPQAPELLLYGYQPAREGKKAWFRRADPACDGFQGEALGLTLDAGGFYCLREGKQVGLAFFEQK